MNLKITGLLVIIAIAVGVVAWINPFKEEEVRQARSPWFYQVSEDDIETIKITRGSDTVSFHKSAPYTWAFDDPEGIPPSPFRWGGVTLLLSGPGTKRDLTPFQPIIEDPAEYGLDNPVTIVDVGLTANRSIQFRLGNRTTDGKHYYSQVSGFPDLFLIVTSWGDVISRLADEPPLPKWSIDRDPEIISELNIILDGNDPNRARMISFAQDFRSNEWTVQDFAVDEEPRPIDMERWESILPLVAGPKDITVAVPLVDDRDYSRWGITDDSISIEVRFAGRTDRGTRFTDGILLVLGDKSEDGQFYYAKSETDYSRLPVLSLDAEWVETILALEKDIPYGEK